MLSLHLSKTAEVRRWDRVEVVRCVRCVELGGCGPLLKVFEDVRTFVVHRHNLAVLGAPSHEPYASLCDAEVSRKSFVKMLTDARGKDEWKP